MGEEGKPGYHCQGANPQLSQVTYTGQRGRVCPWSQPCLVVRMVARAAGTEDGQQQGTWVPEGWVNAACPQ